MPGVASVRRNQLPPYRSVVRLGGAARLPFVGTARLSRVHAVHAGDYACAT